MRESERLRARLQEIEHAVAGDKHAESYRDFEAAYETLYIEHEQAIAALERAEALEQGIARFRDHGLPLVVTVICTLNGAVVGVLVDDINELLGAEATDARE